MNPFTEYAATMPRRAAKGSDKPPSQLDRKMEERQRLAKTYRLARRRINAETLAIEPRLGAFSKWLRSQRNPDEIVTGITESWLPTSSKDVRHYALRLIGARRDLLNRESGFPALDCADPVDCHGLCCRARDALANGKPF